MELVFLVILIVIMAVALASGYPVAFALPGAAIITILLAAGAGYVFGSGPDAYFHSGGPSVWLSAGVTNFRGVYWEVERDTLIAIPLFVFMGIMLERSKIAEDLLLTMAQLFGPIPGGLGISVVFVGALLAATTGILGATVVAMGLISLPAMLRNNYSKPLATGTIAASGTLGQIIPPSIVLIILADQLSSAVDQAGTQRTNLYKAATGELSLPSEFAITSTSAGDMFLGALVPGLVLVGLYMLFILVIGLIRPSMAPSVPFGQKMDAKLVGRILLILVPPLTLIFAVLGSIIAGIATVNQAGAIGAVGAMIMAGYRLREGQARAFWPAALAIVSLGVIFYVLANYELNIRAINTDEDRFGLTLAVIAVVGLLIAIVWSAWRTMVIKDTMKSVMIDTAKTTSLVFIILLGAAMLTAAFRAFGGEELVKEFLTSLPGGFWMQFVIVMAVIFVLGFFLDFIEIAVVVVPIVSPILLMDPEANITAVWLGVMIGLNIQTSFLTPPFGFALFYLRGVAPKEVKTTDIYKGVVPFIALQLVALFIVGNYPPLVNYLPSRLSLLAETAPPPVNPRLQYCMETYVSERFAEDGDAIRQVIATAQGLTLDGLPRSERSDLEGAFEAAAGSFEKMAAVDAAEQAVEAASGAYAPLHRTVRAIERDMRKIEDRLKTLNQTASRLRSTAPDSPRIARIEAQVAELTAERDALAAGIPEAWDGQHDEFAKLTKAEINARRQYQRGADEAMGAVNEMREVLAANDALAALAPVFAEIRADLPSADLEVMEERIKDLASAVSSAEGGSDIGKALRTARNAVRKDADPVAADAAMAEAEAALAADLAWRRKAEADLLPGLNAYAEGIADTIGLRAQSKLPREQALYVAGCNATHRNISLNF